MHTRKTVSNNLAFFQRDAEGVATRLDLKKIWSHLFDFVHEYFD